MTAGEHKEKVINLIIILEEAIAKPTKFNTDKFIKEYIKKLKSLTK